MPTEPNTAKSEALCKNWLTQIDDALKREKDYRTQGQKCVDLYEGKDADNTPFAILYSNTEVLVPAVYNARPIPMVTRRYRDADPVGKAVAEVSTRTLKFLIDTDSQDYDSFDELMHPAVLDGVVTNRGLTRFKYVAEGEKECVYGETVRWDKFFHGYARTWKKVPWIGFEWDMTEEEVKKNFPGANLDRTKMAGVSSETENKTETKEQLTGVTLFRVYEIWDKTTKKVMFFSAISPKAPLRVAEDPFGLSSFFPVPKPLNFMRKITTLVPTPLYEQYRQQAQELNDVTKRLKAIIKAIRYRGAYNAAVEGIEKILKAEDNELVPVENVQSMPDGSQGIDKLLWTVPVNELVQTAQSLVQAREQIKQVIYEITGISDILRGASVASETATAQNIKNQWGTLRLKKMQKEVQRYCRDCLAIMLEIATKFGQQTLSQMTGLQLLTMEQKQQLQAQVQQFQQMVQMAQQAGQQPPQPPMDPAIVQKQLSLPTWEEVMQVMQDQVTRSYKIDIETNSTIDAEAAQDKQDISELLNALSQFLNGLAPLVQQGMMPFNIAKDMLLVIARRYNFGSQLEESLNSMQEPPKAGPDPQAAQDAEVAKAANEAKLQEIKAKMEADAAKHKFEMESMQLEQQIAAQELQIKQEELSIQRQAIGMKAQQMTMQHTQKLQMMAAKASEPKKEMA